MADKLIAEALGSSDPQDRDVFKFDGATAEKIADLPPKTTSTTNEEPLAFGGKLFTAANVANNGVELVNVPNFGATVSSFGLPSPENALIANVPGLGRVFKAQVEEFDIAVALVLLGFNLFVGSNPILLGDVEVWLDPLTFSSIVGSQHHPYRNIR